MKNIVDFFRDYKISLLPNVPDFLNKDQKTLWDLSDKMRKDWVPVFCEHLQKQLAILILSNSNEEVKRACVESVKTVICLRYFLRKNPEANFFQQWIDFMEKNKKENDHISFLSKRLINSIFNNGCLKETSEEDESIIFNSGNLFVENIALIFGGCGFRLSLKEKIDTSSILYIDNFICNKNNQGVSHCISLITTIISYIDCINLNNIDSWREFETKSATL